MTHIFKCQNPCCGVIRHRHELAWDFDDDSAWDCCPACYHHVIELSEMEVRREQCRGKFLESLVTLGEAQKEFKRSFDGDRRAQLGQFPDNVWDGYGARWAIVQLIDLNHQN